MLFMYAGPDSTGHCSFCRLSFISHVTDQLVAAASSAVGRTLKVHLASVVKSVMTDWQSLQWASAEKGEGMPFV